MSMPALLSHFGIDSPRFVTSTGQVVFEGVSKTAGQFRHAAHGKVVPVARHEFHGGEEEPHDQALGPDAWWNNDAEIERHVKAMNESFPAFTYLAADGDLPPCWAGTIDTGRGKFDVAIYMRANRGLPSVTLLKGPALGVNAGRRWLPSPHLYLNGNMCVAARDDWDADQHTAATVVAWAAHWLAAYTEWRISRRWPAKGVLSVAP